MDSKPQTQVTLLMSGIDIQISLTIPRFGSEKDIAAVVESVFGEGCRVVGVTHPSQAERAKTVEVKGEDPAPPQSSPETEASTFVMTSPPYRNKQLREVDPIELFQALDLDGDAWSTAEVKAVRAYKKARADAGKSNTVPEKKAYLDPEKDINW